MSVKELKAFLASRNVNTLGFLEKQDFIAKALELCE